MRTNSTENSKKKHEQFWPVQLYGITADCEGHNQFWGL